MKPRVLLHIGRHKTGTTALQRFLFHNRERLHREHGIYYPLTGVRGTAHHRIGEALQQGSASNPDAADIAGASALLQALLEEIEACSAATILLSSESLQHAPPRQVAETFERFDTSIVVYLRSQLHYLPSAFAQRIHATTSTETLRDYTSGFLDTVNYWRFLKGWSYAFKGAVEVGLYTPQFERQASIITFFKRHLDVDLVDSIESFEFDSELGNPSLSAAITAYKWRVNHRLPQSFPERDKLYRALIELSREPHWAGRLVLDKRSARHVYRRSKKNNSLASDQFLDGENIFPVWSLRQCPWSMYSLSPAEHRKITEKLVDKVPGMKAYNLDATSQLPDPWH